MARKKSWQDLHNQAARIMDYYLSDDSFNLKRAEKVSEITQRYVQNISKRQRKSNERIRDLTNRGKMTVKQIIADNRSKYTRKYSQRTYMGMSNG